MSEENKVYHDHKCECGKVWKCAIVDCIRDPKCFACEFGKRKIPNKRKQVSYATCEAGDNCWLKQDLEYCPICGEGDKAAWVARVNNQRAAMGMLPYMDLEQVMRTIKEAK